MGDRIFSLESVLALREAELEAIERELSRIVRELQLEREKSRAIRLRMECGLASMGEGSETREAGFLLACYVWLEHMDGLIGEQKIREDELDGEYENVRQAWRRARMEKEKILLLREKFRGQERRKALRKEERSLEFWVQSREALGKTSGKGEK